MPKATFFAMRNFVLLFICCSCAWLPAAASQQSLFDDQKHYGASVRTKASRTPAPVAPVARDSGHGSKAARLSSVKSISPPAPPPPDTSPSPSLFDKNDMSSNEIGGYGQFYTSIRPNSSALHGQDQDGKNTQIIINLNHQPHAYLYNSNQHSKDTSHQPYSVRQSTASLSSAGGQAPAPPTPPGPPAPPAPPTPLQDSYGNVVTTTLSPPLDSLLIAPPSPPTGVPAAATYQQPQQQDTRLPELLVPSSPASLYASPVAAQEPSSFYAAAPASGPVQNPTLFYTQAPAIDLAPQQYAAPLAAPRPAPVYVPPAATNSLQSPYYTTSFDPVPSGSGYNVVGSYQPAEPVPPPTMAAQAPSAIYYAAPAAASYGPPQSPPSAPPAYYTPYYSAPPAPPPRDPLPPPGLSYQAPPQDPAPSYSAPQDPAPSYSAPPPQAPPAQSYSAPAPPAPPPQAPPAPPASSYAAPARDPDPPAPPPPAPSPPTSSYEVPAQDPAPSYGAPRDPAPSYGAPPQDPTPAPRSDPIIIQQSVPQGLTISLFPMQPQVVAANPSNPAKPSYNSAEPAALQSSFDFGTGGFSSAGGGNHLHYHVHVDDPNDLNTVGQVLNGGATSNNPVNDFRQPNVVRLVQAAPRGKSRYWKRRRLSSPPREPGFFLNTASRIKKWLRMKCLLGCAMEHAEFSDEPRGLK